MIEFAETCIDEYQTLRSEISQQYPLTINQISQLRAKYPNIPICDMLTQVNLQKKALNKMPFAEKWLWTEKNLQQASTFHLAQYHGTLFERYDTVADICCGIGADLLFISKGKQRCYAVDNDENILRIARYNMHYFQRNNIVYQHIPAEKFSADCEAVYVDPDRRTADRRLVEIQKFSPNIDTIEKLIKTYSNVAVKLTPTLDYEDKKFSEYSFDFVSVNGELKECLLRSGTLKHKKQAVILPKGVVFSEKRHPNTDIATVGQWLFEPDPAIIRAHLVNDLACECNMKRIDENIALLTTDSVPDEIYGKKYQVVTYFDYNLKGLNNYLKSKHIGILDIKTRGFSETVENFRSKLRLHGKEKATIFIVRIKEKHVCIVCCQ